MNRTYYEMLFNKVIQEIRTTNAPRNNWSILKHPEAKTTGNLKYNSLKGQWVEENHYVIYLDENIAPYVPYTNEKWISPRWKGQKNPNENWWQMSVGLAVNTLLKEINKK